MRSTVRGRRFWGGLWANNCRAQRQAHTGANRNCPSKPPQKPSPPLPGPKGNIGEWPRPYRAAPCGRCSFPSWSGPLFPSSATSGQPLGRSLAQNVVATIMGLAKPVCALQVKGQTNQDRRATLLQWFILGRFSILGRFPQIETMRTIWTPPHTQQNKKANANPTFERVRST